MNAAPDAHAEQHEQLLHAHLAGDVPAGDPRLVQRLETCATCRARLLELSSLTDLLERIGDEQRRHLTPSADPAPGADRVAATLQALAQGLPPTHLRPVPAPRRSAAAWRVGLAAASVLVAGWIVKTLLPPATEPREDVLLGDGVDQSVTPSGTVASFDGFDWLGRPSDATKFKIEVWHPGSEFESDPFLQVECPNLPWRPDAEELEVLTSARAIYWEVKAFGSDGQLLNGQRASAELSGTR